MNETTTQATPAPRREGTVMGFSRNKKRVAAAAIAIAGLAGGAVAVNAATFSDSVGAAAPPASWPTIAPTTCAGDPCEITLDVGSGSVTVADVVHGSANVPFLAFGVNGAPAALAGSPNSTIKVPEGTTLHITVTQSAGGDPIELSFPSLLASDVVHNLDGTYTVEANVVGTSVFEPGSNPGAPKQIAQGLVGTLIVTPAGCSAPNLMCAYDTTAYDDEVLLATVDLDLEFAMSPGTFDAGYFGESIDPDFTDRQVYHVLNGMAFPDTEVFDVRAGDNVLVRQVNAGVLDKSLGTLGIRQVVLGRNASVYTDSQTFIAPLVGPGSTADLAVTIPADTPSGHFYSLMDQGRQMNNGSATGFGGALTFYHVWAAVPSVDNLGAVAGFADAAVQVGNPLQDRNYATDFPPETVDGLKAVMVVLDGSPLPAGTLQSFDMWNQATAGGSPNASEGEQFRAYVLRPTGNADEYTVVYDSGVQTVPPVGVPNTSEQFSVPATVAVQAGDVLGYFGSGVPVDIIGSGTDVLVYPSTAVPTLNATLTLGAGAYPIYPQARTYSFAATVTPYSGTTAFTATAHASGAGHQITGYQTVVNGGATPDEIDWSPTTSVGPADPQAISTDVSAVPGQTIWVRAQQEDSAWSSPASIVVPVP